MNRGILTTIGGPCALVLILTTGRAAWGETPTVSSALAQQSPPAVMQGPLGASTRLVAGYGELIVHVTSGGRAEQLGLQTGDVIQAVDGRRVATEGALGQALSVARKNGSLTLKIRAARSGEVTYRTLGK